MKKQMLLNHVYLEPQIQKLFQILVLPERKCCCCCFDWELIDLLHLQSYSEWSCQSFERNYHYLIWWMTLNSLNCFLVELVFVLLWQKFLQDPAQLQNCFFLL